MLHTFTYGSLGAFSTSVWNFVQSLQQKLQLLTYHLCNFHSDVYFRKSGLERSARITKDLEWFGGQGIAVPEPSTAGSTYATYLTELAESNAPAFLSHYYNIYFAHTTGGVAIGNKVMLFPYWI